MNTSLVSIIVPVYNVETYVEQCITSLLGQDYTHIEIIIVNDGSTDRSLSILQSLSALDSRIKVINKKNEGVSAARNVALKQAKGDYVLFVDADDWLDLKTVSNCVQMVQLHNADVCLFTYMREFDSRSDPKFLFDSDKVFDEESCKQLQRRMIGPIGYELGNPGFLDSYGTIWAKLYRREVVKDVRFVDLAIIGTAEDTLFNCNVFLNVHKAVYLNQPFYHYRKFNSGSETKKYKPNLYLQWKKLFEYISETVILDDGSQALYNRIALSMFGLGLNELSSHNSLICIKEKVKQIINQPHYLKAYSNLDFQYFPIHWKLFFGAIKYKKYYIYIFLTYLLQIIINKKK